MTSRPLPLTSSTLLSPSVRTSRNSMSGSGELRPQLTRRTCSPKPEESDCLPLGPVSFGLGLRKRMRTESGRARPPGWGGPRAGGPSEQPAAPTPPYTRPPHLTRNLEGTPPHAGLWVQTHGSNVPGGRVHSPRHPDRPAGPGHQSLSP